MSNRLPIPGADDGTWGDILNAYLEVSHAPDGTLNPGVVGTAQLQNNAVTNSKLDVPTQTSLGKADNALPASQKGAAGGVATLDGNTQLTAAQLPSSVINVSSPISGEGVLWNGTAWVSAGTQTPLDNSTKPATTAYADAAVAVEKSRAETAEAGLAPLASPAFTGHPTGVTETQNDNSTHLATTAYADRAGAGAGIIVLNTAGPPGNDVGVLGSIALDTNNVLWGPKYNALGPNPFATGITALDNLTRADENPLSDGGKWMSPAFSTDDHLALVGNSIVCDPGFAAQTWSSSYWHDTTFTDTDVWATVSNFNAGQVNLVARLTNPNTGIESCYTLVAQPTTSVLKLHKRVAGADTVIHESDGIGLASGDSIGLRCSGTTITVWHKSSTTWALIATVTDTSLTGPGYAGLQIQDLTPSPIVTTFGVGATSETITPQWPATGTSLVGPSGAAGAVGAPGAAGAAAASIVELGFLLSANDTYTGPWIDQGVNGALVMASSYSDQVGTLTINEGVDGSTVLGTLYSGSSSTRASWQGLALRQYIQFVYVNGPTTQTVGQIQRVVL